MVENLKTQAAEPLPPELAAIAGQAAELEPKTPEQVAEDKAVADAVPVDYLTDARGVTDIVSTALGAVYPSTEKVLTEEKRAQFAGALAPVMEKYGVSLGSVLGRYGPEINLIFVGAGFAIPLAQAIRSDRAAAKNEGEAAPQNHSGAMRPVIDRTDPDSLHNKA